MFDPPETFQTTLNSAFVFCIMLKTNIFLRGFVCYDTTTGANLLIYRNDPEHLGNVLELVCSTLESTKDLKNLVCSHRSFKRVRETEFCRLDHWTHKIC